MRWRYSLVFPALFAIFPGFCADGANLNITSYGAIAGDANSDSSAISAAVSAAKAGDTITLRVAKPTDIPLSSIQGRRESTGERIRLTVSRVLDRMADLVGDHVDVRTPKGIRPLLIAAIA